MTMRSHVKLADSRDASRGAIVVRWSGMAVAMLIDNPEATQETYELVRARLGLQKPEGGIFHIAGPSPKGGWRVIEVWESEAEANRFFLEHVLPALRASGFDGPLPTRELWPVHCALR